MKTPENHICLSAKHPWPEIRSEKVLQSVCLLVVLWGVVVFASHFTSCVQRVAIAWKLNCC